MKHNFKIGDVLPPYKENIKYSHSSWNICNYEKGWYFNHNPLNDSLLHKTIFKIEDRFGILSALIYDGNEFYKGIYIPIEELNKAFPNYKSTNMKELFIPYTESLELKELGFDGKCFGHYVKNISRMGKGRISLRTERLDYDDSQLIYELENIPTFSQAFKWFREKGYENWIPHNEEGYQFVIKWEFKHFGGIEALHKINSYEQAELECLRKLIEIIEEHSKQSIKE